MDQLWDRLLGCHGSWGANVQVSFRCLPRDFLSTQRSSQTGFDLALELIWITPSLEDKTRLTALLAHVNPSVEPPWHSPTVGHPKRLLPAPP